jgi:hypothetical protein
MKIGKLVMGATVILLMTGSPHAWSHDTPNSKLHSWKHGWARAWTRTKPRSAWLYNKNGASFAISKNKSGQSGGPHVVPEIDAASGTGALALLTGVLLLTGERSRSRRRK